MPGQAIVRVNENEWAVSLATTYAELVWGLSGVTSIPSGTGMLFVLPTDQPVSVTTEPLLFNIDIIFISSGLEVVDVARNAAPGTIVTESTPVSYFLEVNAGEADGVESGDMAGITIYQPAATTLTNWIAPLVSFAGLMAVGAFMVSTTRSITEAILGEPTEKLKLLPQTEAGEKKTMAAFMEMAEWYCKHRRAMTPKDLRPIATKYFGTEEGLTEFYEYLASPQGQKEFRRELRDAMRRHNIPLPPEEEWLTMTQELLPQTELSRAFIEGGEPMPIQYRYLAGWISEPLPEYSLAVELLPAVEVGERKIDAVLKQLKDGVESIQQSERFRLFLVTMSKFHDYSIGNQILIMIQKPDAIRVAGFNTWKDLGRWVKRGEKGIAILAPVMPPRPSCLKCGTKLPKGVRFCPQCGESVEVEEEIGVTPRYFKVVYVFDISQSEGKPLPEFEVPVLTGEANEELFAKVIDLAKAQGLDISFESRPYQDPSIKGQYFDKSIWVRPEETRAQQLKTLLHEVAHYYSEGVFRIPRRDAETIAESAAFSIGVHFGFDSGIRSFPYVALWAKDKKILEQNLSAIRRVATQIIESLEKSAQLQPQTGEIRQSATVSLWGTQKLLPFAVDKGTCYEDAWRFLIREEEGHLIHGTVLSNGRRIGHAWVVTSTGYIWEPQTKNFYTREVFQAIAEPLDGNRYTTEQAAIMAARTKHLGPWTEEERGKFLKEKSPAAKPSEYLPQVSTATRLDSLQIVKAYKEISRHGEDKISISLQAWAIFPRGRRPHFISMYRSGDEYVIQPLYAHIAEWVRIPVEKIKAWIRSLPVRHFEPMAVAPELREEAERLAKEVDKPIDIIPLPSKESAPKVIPVEKRPRREGDLEYLADSPEYLTQTIDATGYRDKLDYTFQKAIARAKGLK